MFASVLMKAMRPAAPGARARQLHHVLRQPLSLPLVASLIGHGLLVAIIAEGWARQNIEGPAADTAVISIDLMVQVAAPDSEPPQTMPIHALETTSKSEASREVGSLGVTEEVPLTEEIWRPLDPSVERARDLQQLMNLAACPHFDVSAGRAKDPDLAQKCARSLEGMPKGPGAALVAVRAARQQERLALKLGWAVAVVPELDPDAPEAQTSPHRTYAEEAFGPWPWDAARQDGG